MAETEEVVITRHGKPAGVLIGFESEDDWFDYRLESDPRFQKASPTRGGVSRKVAASGSRTSRAESLEASR